MERYYEAIDLLKGMISRPSFSRDETAVADFLQAEWQKAGQKVFRKGNNLWIIAPDFDFGKPTLLLNSHIDTVKPASGWTKDPFTPEETRGRLDYKVALSRLRCRRLHRGRLRSPRHRYCPVHIIDHPRSLRE